MSWITFIWSLTAGICFTLGAVHLLVWTRRRDEWANLVFSITASAAAGYAVLDMLALHVRTPAEYGELWRWALALGMLEGVLIVWFIRLYLKAGRLWLLWVICGLRVLMLVLNFAPGANFYFREVTALQQVPLLGEPISRPAGLLHSWVMLMPLSLVLIIIFAIDAAHTAAKRDRRPRPWVLGGLVAVGFSVALASYALYARGILPSTFSSQLFLSLMMLMGYELSLDVLRAGQLSRELLKSQQRMQLAASAADLSFWEWDIIRDEIWVTDRGRERAGIDAAEHINFARFLDAIHSDDREPTQRAVRDSLEGKGEFEAEYRVAARDGVTRWVVARGHVERDTHGKPIRLRGISVNITERKKAEGLVRQSEEFQRAILDSVAAEIAVLDAQGVIVAVNAQWQQFALANATHAGELPRNTGIGANYLEVCRQNCGEPSDAATAAYEGIRGVISGRSRSFSMEYACHSPQQQRWFVMSVTPLRQENRSVVVAHLDITERKQAEERFRLTVESSPNGILLANSGGRMVLVNAQTEKLFGYSRAELIGQPVEILLPERFRGAHPGHRTDFFAKPKARAMGAGRELFARRKDGTEFPVEIGLSPIETEEGTLVLTAIVDITARKQAEAELAQHRNELSHLSRVATMSELSSSLAHELNQPLAIILTNAQAAKRLLAQDPPDVAETRDILEDIVSEDERAGEVIRRLRALLKPGQTQRLPLSINEIIEDVLRIARSDLIGRGVMVHTALSDGLPQVLGDRIQLQQVLLNLILNGSDAMAGNPSAQRVLTIATARADGRVRISVADKGCGLPPEPERIFQPFYTTKKDGLGLGLAICRSIISAHEGRLWAEGGAGGSGAMLNVELPAEKEQKQ